MKKSLIISLLWFCTTIMNAETEYSLKRYFQDNILQLDPIEGVYDVQSLSKYVTPYVNQADNNHWTYYIKETYKGSKTFNLYMKDNNDFHQSYNCKITRIGETPAYYFYYQSSQARFVLENETYFRAVVPLDHSSAVKITGNPDLHPTLVKITLIYECIKTFPTSSMYLEAAQKEVRIAEHELQKALEEAQKKAGWSGSGFALNQGYIVTNYHVVEDAKTILVKGVKGDFNTELRATVAATDKVNDIAVIKIEDERFKGFGTIPYKVKLAMLEVGEFVWALGYPMTDIMGEEVKFTDGKISSRTGIQGDISVYQISVPIQPGNSGGALFDNYGNVVGITSSGLNREEFNSENVNYAIKTSYLYNLVESSLISSILPQGTAMKDQPLTQKIKLAKNFVFIILCSSSSDFHADKLPSQSKGTVINKPNDGSNNQSSAPQTLNKVIRDTLANGNIVIKSPMCRNNTNLTISKVVLTRLETIIEFKWQNTQYFGGWCSVDRNAYIKDPVGNIYQLKFAENISYSPDKDDVPYGSVKTFVLHFDKLPYVYEKFDFIEADNSKWKIYDITIK